MRIPLPGARLGYGLAGVAAAVGLAELLPRLGVVDPRHLPPVSRIAAALGTELGQSGFWLAVADTLAAWAQGLLIAVVAGVVCGVVIASVPGLRAATASTIEFLRPIPSVALIPLAILLLGTGIESTLLLVVYASFWQVLIQVIAGINDIDSVAADTARSFRLSAARRVWHLALPSALPYILTGVRLAASVALVLAVTAELVIGAPGLGHEISVAKTSAAVPRMYALIAVTGILGVAVNLAARGAERRLLRWHPSIRQEVPA
ncbi:ABC transporter permease [Stackebrandtia nassauensis]|uniref:Binding-protein-dependent transport systems inner membrane component n=1 Tax=Stackebrandtia nassauensis (strain DSM 44728 / CIP 108903 / NRRL B-16338 / NBRC 102104 / LLR-40K-21) TaxID=446470 RepID=D3Q3H7_STANL|nr:ABC transporter permease subunit [Stackebrandtia nassauensis]ADD42018.1 binding-protein-dependent transport systems inner membrane component [Stackebrandtia nassauensis DSM 44728]